MSNNKVTYILGAGASAKNEKLPTVAQYDKALIKCAASIDNERSKNTNPIHKGYFDTWIDNVQWLAEKSIEFNTVDTYAQWCWKNDPIKLEQVKATLMVFFMYEQLVNKKLDARYIQFITDISDKEFNWPSNVKIINWNYDSQMQIASNKNKKKEYFSRDTKGNHIYTPGILYYYPYVERRNKEFDMLHMNGIAGIYQSQFYGRMKYEVLNNVDGIESFLGQFEQDRQRQYEHFNFAFERNNDILEMSRNMVKFTDIVVIIGYSFPSVNDKFDTEMFDVMKEGDGIKKIYVQNRELSPDTLRRRFDLPESTFIEPVWQYDSFHVALEYRREKDTPAEQITRLIKRQR